MLYIHIQPQQAVTNGSALGQQLWPRSGFFTSTGQPNLSFQTPPQFENNQETKAFTIQNVTLSPLPFMFQNDWGFLETCNTLSTTPFMPLPRPRITNSQPLMLYDLKQRKNGVVTMIKIVVLDYIWVLILVLSYTSGMTLSTKNIFHNLSNFYFFYL